MCLHYADIQGCIPIQPQLRMAIYVIKSLVVRVH